MENIEIKIYKSVSESLLEILASLDNEIFDSPYSIEKLRREASVKNHFLALVAFENQKPCGFKVGFELSSRLFYSWIGGVLPSHRGKGIAKKLIERQHFLILEQGHTCVRTYTENKYRDMLILNIKSGFDIIGVYKSDHDEKQTIMLEKMLTDSP